MEGVYIIGNKKAGLYKIGYSTNIESRFETLQAYSLCPLEIAMTVRCLRKYLRALEKYLHKTYAEKRKHGEWFALTLNDISRCKDFIELWKAGNKGAGETAIADLTQENSRPIQLDREALRGEWLSLLDRNLTTSEEREQTLSRLIEIAPLLGIKTNILKRMKEENTSNRK